MSAPVIICGSIAFDSIMVFEGQFQEHILPEQVHKLSVSFLVPTMRKEFGGCAGNIAYNLKLLGGQPIPVATVGQDGLDYQTRLKDLGIDTRWVKVASESYTAQCFITTDLSDNQITAFHPGAMALSAANDLRDAPGEWAIVAPDAKDAMFAHAERLHARGVPFIFDLGQAMPLFDGEDLTRMLKMARALTVNDYEASVVVQRTGRSLAELSQSLDAVVVTHGEEGATVIVKGVETTVAPVAAAQVVDPTGCGDAHRAGLLFGLISGWNWVDACSLGNLMGSIKIAERGPQNHAPSREDIAGQLKAAYGLSLPEAAIAG
ncbi:carbohydrate kinase family protein [Pigmentiphaga aceris]|uniref:Carbohydrate kinase family protein n=1 Tax=Pigmentiphaga aceris TaxID=1940612 RepID=A0A5C0ATR9_9BURK|nr:carbohydrate kinase family protein [Pigmentiphaga aceris]QEI05066.1 carbohydrate kinase family protein [Pigmentiphaga aceris]